MQTWPSTLPQSPFTDENSEPSSGLLSPEEKNNPIRIRTYPEKGVTFRFEGLTAEELQLLITFYNVTLNQSAPFSAPWLASIGFPNFFLRFSAPPKFVEADGVFDVDVTFEAVAGVPVSGGVAYWLP